MSAFVISNQTMQRVVRTICAAYQARSDGQIVGWFADELTWHHGSATTIGKKLFALNADAVAQRYPCDEITAAPDFTAPDGGNRLSLPDLVDGWKAIECLIYQCSEGSVPGKPLYAELIEAHGKVGAAIIALLPEYKAASWG